MTVDKLLGRYTPEERSVIFRFLDKLAKMTRKTGEISDSKKEKIIISFESFDAGVVIASLNIYLNMDIQAAKGGKGKNEKYVRGIMLNKQEEKNAKAGVSGGRDRQHAVGSVKKGTTSLCGDEGERLHQLAASSNGGQLDCDF